MPRLRTATRRWWIAATIALGWLFAASPVHATLAWSPDGRWLAFTEREGPAPVGPGWLFTPRPVPKPAPPAAPVAGGAPAASRPVNAAPPVKVFRLWIASADGTDVRQVAESSRPLDGLAWHPLESKLAYVRIGEATAAGEPWEVVLHAGDDRPERVIYREVIPKAPFQRTPSAYALAWRHDGALLAAMIGDALLTLDVPSGRVLGKRTRGAVPSWSQTGERLAFQQQTFDDQWIPVVADASLANGDTAQPNARRTPPAIWEEDGDLLRLSLAADRAREVSSVSITRTHTIRTSNAPVADRQDLLTVAVSDREASPIVLRTGPPRVPPKYEGAWLASVDPRTLYLLVRRSERPTRLMAINPAHPDRPEWRSPIDAELRLAELALSPDGRRLATRAGRPDVGCPLIYDLNDRRTTFLAASLNLRLTALQALAEAVESVAFKRSRPAPNSPFLARLVAPPPATLAPPRRRAPPAIDEATRFDVSNFDQGAASSDDADDDSPWRIPQLLDAAQPLLAQRPDEEQAGSRALDEQRLFFAFAENNAHADALWGEAFARLAAAPRSAEENVRLLAVDARRLRRRGRMAAALLRLDEAQDALDRATTNRTIKPEGAATLNAVLDDLLQSDDDASPSR